ncbi:MAG TPA: VTT domain-containing protein [Pyrinomonadaceae bacterium]|jgi:membrane-associated protein|nr:VTT domain-containing protein [Pyrinomonadaceae bacterium]
MQSLLEFLYQIKDYLNPKFIIEMLLDKLGPFVYVGLFFIIFAETGLAVGFFFPGDSLLVVAGLFAAAGKLNIAILLMSLFAASVIGDSTGYFTGKFMGKRLFNRENSWVFKPSRVEKAKKFFEKHGPKTIILARFVPIVRTFAPIVIGAAELPYKTFISFSLLGSFLWIFSMTLLGYFVGGLIETAFGIKLEEHIEKVVIVVVLLSLLPPLIEYLKHRSARKKAPQEVAEEIEKAEI